MFQQRYLPPPPPDRTTPRRKTEEANCAPRLSFAVHWVCPSRQARRRAGSLPPKHTEFAEEYERPVTQSSSLAGIWAILGDLEDDIKSFQDISRDTLGMQMQRDGKLVIGARSGGSSPCRESLSNLSSPRVSVSEHRDELCAGTAQTLHTSRYHGSEARMHYNVAGS